MIRLRSATGSSTLQDGQAAGRAAATAAVAGLDGQEPALVLVFTSVRYDLDALVGGIREVTGSTPLAGATSCGHFRDGALTAPGEGVVVLALTAGPYRFGVASVTGIRAGAFEAGRALARDARDAAGPEPLPHAAVVLLSGSLGADQQELLNGLYRVTGASVPVVGGAAGDDRRLQKTWVLHGDQVLTDAAVAIWVGADHPLTVHCGQGWQPISLPMMVTQSDGAVVDKIGGRPAVEVFREHIQHDREQDADHVREGGWHSAHAFGLIEPDGTQLIRGAFIDGEDVLRTFIPLPAFAAVQVVSSGPDTLLEVTNEVVGHALGQDRPGLVLGFSCVARLDILGDRGDEEAKRFQAAAGDTTTFGFYTYGEFARTVGVAGVHNATLAVIAL
jgi:hypothetical protein